MIRSIIEVKGKNTEPNLQDINKLGLDGWKLCEVRYHCMTEITEYHYTMKNIFKELKVRLVRFISFLKNKKKFKTISVVIPKGWMNCGVSIDNHFISDTNNSVDYDFLKFPLPSANHKWNIKCYLNVNNNSNKQTVVLIDKKQ
jgi:hypothetical protein